MEASLPDLYGLTNSVGSALDTDLIVNESAYHPLEYISGYRACMKNLLRDAGWISAL